MRSTCLNQQCSLTLFSFVVSCESTSSSACLFLVCLSLFSFQQDSPLSPFGSAISRREVLLSIIYMKAMSHDLRWAGPLSIIIWKRSQPQHRPSHVLQLQPRPDVSACSSLRPPPLFVTRRRTKESFVDEWPPRMTSAPTARLPHQGNWVQDWHSPPEPHQISDHCGLLL